MGLIKYLELYMPFHICGLHQLSWTELYKLGLRNILIVLGNTLRSDCLAQMTI